MKLRPALALSAAALVLLTGCGELAPGTAAQVGDRRITSAQVDDLTTAQCAAADAAAAAGQSTGTAIAKVRQGSLALLLDTALSDAYAEDEGVEATREVADALYAQYSQGLEQLPAAARDGLEPALRDWTASQAALASVGAKASGTTATTENFQDTLQAGLASRDEWRQGVEVDTDPRYAPGADGFPGTGDGSVSRAVSDFAQQGAAEESSPAWVGALPAGQVCG